MPLLPTEQKDQLKVMVAIIAVALGVAYYMYPYASREEALAEQLTHLESIEATNEKARAELARGSADKLKAQAARSRASLEALRRLVPAEHEVPALLEEVSNAARRAGLELGGVGPEPVLAGDGFDAYRYKVSVTGPYHALTTFLANVGSLPRIVAPVTFALTPSPRDAQARSSKSAAPAVLQATVTIQTYVARTATPQPAPAGATTVAARSGEVLP